MVVSKCELAMIEITKADSKIPSLNCVHFCNDGTVASNGEVIAVMSPLEQRILKAIPFKDSQERFECTIVSDTISTVLKNIPNDTMFKGALEFCTITKSLEGKILFDTTDGKINRTIEGKLFPYGYIMWRRILRQRLKRISLENLENHIILHNKSFFTLLSSVAKISGTKDIPIFLQTTGDNSLVFRTIMPKTLQRLIAVTLPAKSKWIGADEWENSLTQVARRKDLGSEAE